MADKKISELSAGGTPENADAVPIARSSSNFSLAMSDIKAYATAGLVGLAISAGTTLASTGTVQFANSNGVSWGLDGQTVTATVKTDYLTTAALSNHSHGFSADGGSSAFQTLSFSNGGGVSFTNTNGQVGATVRTDYASSNHSHGNPTLNLTNLSGTTASASNGLTLSLLGAVGSGFTSAGNNIGLSGTLTTNGLSLSATVAAQTAESQTLGMSNLGNTSGTTGVASGAQVRMLFAGGNNITLSQSLNGASGTITISAANAAPSPVNFSAGTTSGDLGSVVFSNSNGVTFGLNGSTITGSVAGLTRSGYFPYPDIPLVVGQVGQGTLMFDPVRLGNFQHDRVVFQIHNTNSSNSSGSHTLSLWVGLYTQNASTLSLVASTSSSTALTHSGTAGSYSLYSGIRHFTIPWTRTVTQGDYVIGFLSRTTSGGANGTYSNLVLSNVNSNFLGHFGSSHATTYQFALGKGVYTATTNAMPNSVGFTEIRGSDSNALRPPHIMFASGTV